MRDFFKLGANRIDESAEICKKEQGKKPTILVVICGLCDAAYRREDGVLVVPITALRP